MKKIKSFLGWFIMFNILPLILLLCAPSTSWSSWLCKLVLDGVNNIWIAAYLLGWIIETIIIAFVGLIFLSFKLTK